MLKEEFGDSVNRLLEQVKRQKDIIIKSYGPLMLEDKKSEAGLYDIPIELDPQGYRQLKELESA